MSSRVCVTGQSKALVCPGVFVCLGNQGLGMSSRVCVTGQSKVLVCIAVFVCLGNQRPWYVQPCLCDCNQRPWYVQPCLCDWAIKGLGMYSRVCVPG